jgi:hypothetical protein
VEEEEEEEEEEKEEKKKKKKKSDIQRQIDTGKRGKKIVGFIKEN